MEMKKLIASVVISALLIIAFLWKQSSQFAPLLYVSVVIQIATIIIFYLDKSISRTAAKKILLTFLLTALIGLSCLMIVYSRILMVR